MSPGVRGGVEDGFLSHVDALAPKFACFVERIFVLMFVDDDRDVVGGHLGVVVPDDAVNFYIYCRVRQFVGYRFFRWFSGQVSNSFVA